MINPNTHLVEVLAPIPEQEVKQLVLGSRILGKIHLTSHIALVVPRSAVLGDDSNFYLYTVIENKAKRISIQTGVEDGELIEVTGNLNVNDVVVISGNYELSDGLMISVKLNLNKLKLL
jgi:membrane fusion protein, multidrug efflux system